MDIPDRDMALSWVGRTLVDRDGAEIGVCTAVFTDDATRRTEWVCSEVAGASVFIPAVGAAESGERVQVAVSRADVTEAPAVGGEDHISADEEIALYRHYGIPHSRDASPTVFPTDSQESDAAAPGEMATPATDSTAAPVEKAAPLAEHAPDAGEAQPAGPSGRRRQLVGAVGGLATVGMALGAVLGARRLRRRRPPTRTERLVARGRAVSAALTAGATQVAASAAPALRTTKQAVRRRPVSRAVALGVPTAATLAAALRRRRSHDPAHN